MSSSRQEPIRQRGSLGRALRLTTVGTILPGAGLTQTRHRILGWLLVLTSLIGVGLLITWVWRNGALDSALDLATRPGFLRVIAGLLIVGGVLWAASVVLTAVTTKPRPLKGGQRSILTAFTALMCLLLAAPVTMGVWYINAHTTAVDRIFVPSANEDEEDEDDSGDDDENVDPWAGVERVNILLLGSDADDSREGVRTDSMIVASLDPQTGDMVMFSIPRNLEDVPVPDSIPLSQAWPNGYDCGAECLVNGIWTEAENHATNNPELYEDQDPSMIGRTAIREVLGAVLGITIDHTAIVNLEGFQSLVDAMGGVEIDVNERLPMGGVVYTDAQGNSQLEPGTETGYIEPGLQILDGREALWYARSRVTTDDFSRMRRQRCVVAALVDQVNPMNMAQRYPQIAQAAGDNVTVDISPDDLPDWAELVERVQNGSMESLPFTIENTNVANPDFEDIQARVDEALAPEPEPTADQSQQTEEAAGSDSDTGDSESDASGTNEDTSEDSNDSADAGGEAPADEGSTEESTETGSEDGRSSTEAPDDDALADVGAVC